MQKIETTRLTLRRFKPEDLDDIARIFAKANLMKFLGVAGETLTRVESEKALLSMIAHWERHKFGRWAVVYKDDDRLIGYSGLRSFGKNAELVYLLDEPYWGRGLATEAAKACLKFGFDVHQLDYVVALVKPGNLASSHVLEKLGMRYEGIVKFFNLMTEMGMPSLANQPDEDIDVRRYSILKEIYRLHNP